MDGEIALGRRRGRCWTKIGYGVYHRGEPDAASRLRGWQELLPVYVSFTHLTAAAVHGLWLPPLPAGTPTFVGVPRDRTRPKRPELVARRHSREIVPVIVGGLRVLPVADTVLACARDLGLLDLTVLVDSALRHPDCSREALERAAASRAWGAPALGAALALSDGRSESAWETMLRSFHGLCGITVVPQHVVREEWGGFVARGDLWLEGTRTIHEYDGAVHRDRSTHVADLARDRRLVNAGWTRRGYTSQDLLGRAHLVLREADRAVGRAHDPRRLQPWYDALQDSLWTATGRKRFTRRVENRR